MEEKIKSILEEVLDVENGQLASITDEDDLFEFGLDSLKAIEVIVNLEEEFDIMIDDEDLLVDNLRTLQKISEIINKYKGE